MSPTADAHEGQQRAPDVSFVMPCYNEDQIVGFTIQRLVGAFERAGVRLELIAVDNGSRDRTGEIIQDFAVRFPGVVRYHRAAVNEGYGNGILAGLPLATAPWVGIITADAQVDAEDAVRLYESVVTTNGLVLGKVRRRFRMDGPLRKVVSITFNLLVWALWPTLESLDVNGNPKILRHDYLRAMNLRSRNWLLDAEIMIKAHYMGLRVHEFNVFARMRSNGVSHVRASTCWEFLKHLLIFRFSPTWRREMRDAPREAARLVAAGPAA